ncbi:preprotein translocase subunit YajC [Spirochaetia bacterium]|nr:preprotein translocase subunit YajC [Spirochaetia bacterium]GHV91832.1 preprotein translocase subunit YajC [Spirochaetia bacterium]
MNSFMFSLLLGAPQGADGAPAGPASFVTSLIPFAAIIGIFYFLIIRPQNKKQKETQKMLGAIKKGDRIITIGGLHGVIQSVKDSSVIVKVDDNVKLEFNRSAISSVESVAKEEKAEKAEKIEDKTADKKAEADDSANKDGEN